MLSARYWVNALKSYAPGRYFDRITLPPPRKHGFLVPLYGGQILLPHDVLLKLLLRASLSSLHLAAGMANFRGC